MAGKFLIHEIGRIDGRRGFQTGGNVFRIGGNTFYDQKNKFSMKIPEFKRSGMGLIMEFRGIPNGFPNQVFHLLSSDLPLIFIGFQHIASVGFVESEQVAGGAKFLLAVYLLCYVAVVSFGGDVGEGSCVLFVPLVPPAATIVSQHCIHAFHKRIHRCLVRHGHHLKLRMVLVL
jgi:hypothetical protein